MPSINCKCGEKLGYGEIPNPIEWLIISDKAYDGFAGMIDSEALYKDMKNILKCSNCGRLWVFWNGFESEPSCYAPEL
jgi:hypothetical protein